MFFPQKLLLIGSPLYLLIMVLFFIFNDYSISPFLPILPVVYALGFYFVFVNKNNSFKSIAVSSIFAIWFFRIVFIPCIWLFSGYTSHITVDAGLNHLNSAVILVSYEFTCVVFLIVLDKKIDLITKIARIECCIEKRINMFVFLVLLVAICASISCIMYDKSVLFAISSIFDKFNYDADVNLERRKEIAYAYANSKLVYSFFQQSVYYLQILIPAILLSFCNSLNRNKTKKGALLSIFVVLGSLLITTDNNIDSVYIMIATGIVTFLFYQQIMKKYIVQICVMGIFFIFYFLIKKNGSEISADEKFFSYLSATLCAYFSSLPNISAGFSMVYENKLETFFGDIVAGVPYMMAFFKGFPKSVTIYNEVVHGYTGEVNQIVPLITSGFHYLGAFAPLLTLMVYEIAFKMELCLRKAKTIFNQVLFALIVVNLSTGPCIFGFPNTLKRLCLFLPLIALAYINERVHTNK